MERPSQLKEKFVSKMESVVLRGEGFVVPKKLKKKTVVEIRVGDTVLVQQFKITTQAVLKEKKESREKTAGGVLRRPQTDNDAKYDFDLNYERGMEDLVVLTRAELMWQEPDNV